MGIKLDSTSLALLAFIISFFVIVFLVDLVPRARDFAHELDYLNREIQRSVGKERRYWKREKRRLWLSLLPFYGRKAQ